MIFADVLDDLEAENCRRVAAKPAQEPIWPVSLHYFLRDDKKTPRPVPIDVQKRTDEYKAGFANRCKNRTPVKDDGSPCLANPLAKGCS